MVEIPTLDPSEAPRARRWDALVLGSGVAALVAAARISAAGQRVLVVEEEARATLAPALKARRVSPMAALRDDIRLRSAAVVRRPVLGLALTLLGAGFERALHVLEHGLQLFQHPLDGVDFDRMLQHQCSWRLIARCQFSTPDMMRVATRFC